MHLAASRGRLSRRMAMSVRMALRGDDQNPNDEEDAEDFEAEVKSVTIRDAVAAARAGFCGAADFFFALGTVDKHGS